MSKHNPTITISLEGIKKLFQDGEFKQALSHYLDGRVRDKSSDQIGFKFFLYGRNYAIQDNSQIVLKYSRTKKGTKQAQDMKKLLGVKMIGFCEQLWYENVKLHTNNMFPATIDPKGPRYKKLIHLASAIEEKYKEVNNRFPLLYTLESYYPVMMSYLFSACTRSKDIDIQNISSEENIDRAMERISNEIVCRTDPHKSLTMCMIQHLASQGNIKHHELHKDYVNYRKLMKGVQLLMKARQNATDQTEAAYKKFIPLWIKAALQGYTGFYGAQINLDLMCSFVSGTMDGETSTAIKRYTDLIASKIRKKDEDRKKVLKLNGMKL